MGTVRDPAKNEPMISVVRPHERPQVFYTFDGVFEGPNRPHTEASVLVKRMRRTIYQPMLDSFAGRVFRSSTKSEIKHISCSFYLCPICLGPLSFAINSAVGIAGSVVMLIVPREPKSTDK
jgi:hypothetical protein